MTKRSIILLLGVCFSVVVFAVRTQSETGGSNQTVKSPDAERSRNMTEQEKNKEHEKFVEHLRNMTPEQAIKALKEKERERAEIRRQRELREKELAKEERKPRIDRAQQNKEFQERVAKTRKEFLYEKSALGATDEQWKVIKAKLEKVRYLRDHARSTAGLGLTSSSGSGTSLRTRARPKAPTWQWKRPWKNKTSGELTDAQKLAKQLIALVERKDTTPEQFRRTMDALRKARRRETEIEKQLSEAREKLREGLTPRQEAALVLMRWL